MHLLVGSDIGNNFTQTKVSIGCYVIFVAQTKAIVTPNEPIGPRIRLKALNTVALVAKMLSIFIFQIFVSFHVDNLRTWHQRRWWKRE